MSHYDGGRPEWPPAGGGTPAGPLGRAFADLAADAPPTELSAHDIMNAAHEQSHRRHRWVLATGVAAAAIAVTTLIGVSVSQSGSGSDTSGAVAGPASSSRRRRPVAARRWCPRPAASRTSSRGNLRLVTRARAVAPRRASPRLRRPVTRPSSARR